MPAQHAERGAGHAVSHVARLLDGRHEMVAIAGEEKRGRSDFAEPLAQIIALQHPQALQIPSPSGPRRQLHEPADLSRLRVTRMQPEGREPADDAHHPPRKRQPTQHGDPQPQPCLGQKARKRIEYDEPVQHLRMGEREAQRDRPAERFAHDRGAPLRRCRTDDLRQVPDQVLHRRVFAERVRNDAIPARERRHLPVKQLAGAIHPRHQNQQRSLARNPNAWLVHAGKVTVCAESTRKMA